MSKHDQTVGATRSAGRARALKRSGLLLSAAVFAIAIHNPAYAQLAPDALPTGGAVVGGAATFDGSVPSALTINQTSDRAVINWNTFDIGANATVNFAQPFTTSIAVNRVTGGGAPSQIAGKLNANGTVAVLNANGVLFAGTADVNVGGLIASTGDIDPTAFMAGGGNLNITGATGGEIVVEGGASIDTVGLAALVAPTVRNRGTIVATAGKVQLGGGTAFTLDLAGDGLLSIGVGANSPLVENSGQIFATGGRIQLTARQAGSLVSQSVSTRVLPATTATVDGNAIVLSAADNVQVTSDMDVTGNLRVNGHRIFGAGDINVAGAGTLTLNVNQGGAVADTSAGSWINDALGVIGTVGGGTTINLGAGLYRSGTVINASNVTLDGQGVAKIGWTSGVENAIDIWGSNVTVKNLEIAGPATQAFYLNDWGSTNSRGIFVNRFANNVTVTNNNIHDIRTGIIVDGRNLNATITNNIVENTKSGISVQYTNGGDASTSGLAGSSLTIAGNREGTFGNEWGINVQLNGVWDGNAANSPTASTSVVNGYSVGILGAASVAEQQRILALSTANNGMATQNLLYSSANRTRAYVSATGIDGRQGSFASSLATVQAGATAVVAGGTVHIGAGTFAGLVTTTRGISLIGAGMNATSLTGGIWLNGTMSNVVLKNFTVSGQVNSTNTTIRNQNITTNLTVDGVRIDGLGVTGRHGIVGGQIAGAVSVTNSEFVNLRGFAAFDTGSSTGNNAITVGTFSNNLLDNTVGSVAFRPDPAMNATITIANNVVRNVGSTTDNVGAVFKVFGGATVNFTGNNVSGVGITNAATSGGPAAGSVLVVRNANLLNVTGNTFTNNNQVFAVDNAANLPTVTNFSNNTFTNNGTSIYISTNYVGNGTINFGAGNNFVAGADTGQHIIWRSAAALDLTGVSFNGALASSLSLADQFALENRITHGTDLAGAGVARTVAGQVFVSNASGSIQRGVTVAGVGDTVNVQAGTYSENVVINKTGVSLVGAGRDVTTINGISNVGALGTVTLAAGSSGTTLSGFTINGIENGNPGSETAAVYLQQTNTGSTIRDNRIVAAGDLALLSEWSYAITGLTVDNNIIGGKTYTGAAPATGDQFTVPNVSRQLVALGGGGVGGGIAFTNNTVNGDSGLNTGVTIDAAGSTITGNSFGTTTGGFGAMLRVRGAGATISGNSFNTANLGATADALYITTPVLGVSGDFAALVAANTVVGKGVWADASTSGNHTLTVNVHKAVAEAATGTTVHMLDGTYNFGTTQLALTRSVNLVGQSQGGVIFDGRAVTQNGLGTIAVQADNVSLSNFTLYGSEVSGGNYGIKVAPNPAGHVSTPGGTNERLNNFAVSDVTVKGSRRAELDMNGVVNATITNFTADGRSVATGQNTAGAGIQITDSSNVTFNGVHTLGNDWGGVALYQSNSASGYNAQTGNINIDASQNVFEEVNGLYTQRDSTTQDFGQLNLTGFNYAVRNTGHRADGSQFTFFRTSLADAKSFALALGVPTTSSIEGYTGTAFSNVFTVDSGFTIGAAARDVRAGGTINVGAGTYAENVTINKTGVSLLGAGRDVTTINGISNVGALGTVTLAAGSSGTTLSAFTINGIENGNPGSETAAVYLQQTNTGSTIRDNRIVAAGDLALLSEWSYAITGLTVDNNIIGGKTYTGAAPATGDQFTVPNVSRQLVALGGGGVGGAIAFTNNVVNGDSGLNTGVTIDAAGSTITGNSFGTTTGGFGAMLRVRGAGAAISGNSFNTANLGATADALYITTPVLGAGGDFAALVAANTVVGKGVWADASTSGNHTLSNSIHKALAEAATGTTVHMLDGTYVISNQIALTRSVNLVGQSQAGVIIDGRTVNDGGGLGTIMVAADNTSLSNFTLKGSELSGGNYGIKVQPNPLSYAVTQRVNNIAISDVTVSGSRRAELDINGAVGVTVTNFTADGQGTAGAGVQITDSADVTLTGVHTLNNAWGGVALYQTNRAGGYDGQTTNINISAFDNNVFEESNGLFSQLESTTQGFGTLNLTGYNFTVRNAAHRAGGEQFTFFRTSSQDALNFAVNLNPAATSSSVVQGWDGSADTRDFLVGFGSLNGGGVTALSIQTAFNVSTTGDRITIGSGIYNESATLNGGRALTFSEVTVNGMTLNGAGTSVNGTLTSTGGISFANDVTLTDTTSLTATGNLALAGVTGAYGLTLSGDTVSIGAASLASLAATGNSIVSNGAVTTGAQSYIGATTLNGTYTASDLGVAGAATLGGDTGITAGGVSLGTVDGAHALTVTATGAASLGAVSGLTSLAVTGATIASNGAATSGAQSYTGATTLNGSYAASSFDVNGAATLGSDTGVTAGSVSLGTIDGAHGLTVDATGAVSLGAASGLTSLAVTGATIASNGAATSGTQSFTGALTLNGAYSASGFAANGASTLGGDASIAAGSVSLGTVGGAHALTVNATGAASLGAVSGLTALAVTGATIASNGAATTGAQSYTGATTLNGTYAASSFGVNGASTLGSDTGITAGGVSLGTVGGAHALTVTATGAASLGAVSGLTSLAVTGATVASNGAATSGAQSYTGATTLNGTYAASSFGVNGASTLGSDTGVTAGSVSLGTVGGAHALTVNATGAASLGAVSGLTSLAVTGATITSNGAATSGTQSFTGALTLGGAYSASSFGVNGAATLGGDASIAAGSVSLGTVGGAHALTINATDAASLGAVSGLTSLSATGATIASNGAATTGAQSYTGATTLNGSYAASSFGVTGASTLGSDTGITAGGVSLGTVGGAHGLAVTATGAVSLGAANGLTTLAVTGATIASNGASTTGTQSFTGATTLGGAYAASSFGVNGAATLGSDTGITAGAISLGTVGGAHALTVNATGAASLGAVSGLTLLAVTGATIASNGAATSGAQSYTGATTLNGAYTGGAFTVAGGTTLGSNASIAGTSVSLGTVTGARSLVINATGAASLGAVTGLTSLDVTGASVASSGATTSGTQRYAGATTLNGGYVTGGSFTVAGAATLGSATTLTTGNGNASFGTVNGANALTIAAGTGSVTLGAANLASLSVTGAMIATNGVTTAGAQSYTGATSLNGAHSTGGSFAVTGGTTVAGASSVTTGGGAISLGTVDGGQALSLNAGTGTATIGAVGGTTALGAFSVNAGQTVLNAAGYRAASIAFTGGTGSTVRLTQGTTSFTTTNPNGGGAISITPQLIGTVAGAQNVVFAAGTGTSANDGDITLVNAGSDAIRLGTMTANGRNFSAATVKLAGNFTSLLSGTQVFSANTLDTLGNVNSTVRGSESGSIRAGGSVAIQSNGSGSGSVVASGPITLSYGSDVTRLITSSGAVSVATSGAIGGSVSGTQVNLQGGTGAVTSTVNATGPVTISTTSGAIGGSVTATGPVTLTATSGSVGASVNSGGATTINSGSGAVTSAVNSTGAINIATTGAISGTLNSTGGGAITLTSDRAVTVQVNGGAVTINAPGGIVTGVFSQITTDAAGTFLINQEPVIGTGVSDARQIIIDSFVVPAGGTVGPNGEIQLPVGLALGLIAPAGRGEGARPPVVVNSVSRLGELLRTGYTAIIIQLDESNVDLEEELVAAE